MGFPRPYNSIFALEHRCCRIPDCQNFVQFVHFSHRTTPVSISFSSKVLTIVLFLPLLYLISTQKRV